VSSDKNIKTVLLTPNRNGIETAANFLKKRELVSFPTETVYGLGASAYSNHAVAKIFSVKGRPTYNPLIVHIADPEDVKMLALIPNIASKLIKFFWPGPLTLVLPKIEKETQLSSLVTGNLNTVAIRCPSHPLARALIKKLGEPIAAPSANISGKISPTRAKDVLNNLDGRISSIINGDRCTIGLESTIIGFEDELPILLRPGGIPLELIEEKLGIPLKTSKTQLTNQKKVLAPGMLKSHYSPDATLKLNVRNPQIGELFLGFGTMPNHCIGLCLSQNSDLSEAASNLFASLTDLDLMAKLMTIKTIAVAPIPKLDLGLAINDRLKRAATPKY